MLHKTLTFAVPSMPLSTNLCLGADLAKAASAGGFEGLRTYMRRICVDAYHRKAATVSEVDPQLLFEAQRFFLLTQIDMRWKEHLQVR